MIIKVKRDENGMVIIQTHMQTSGYKDEDLEESDVWLTVHRNSVWIRKTNWMSLFVLFISLPIVAQYVSGNYVCIIRS